MVAPASALQVKVAPAKPQLGDTLSVTIEQDGIDSSKSVTSSPVVTFNQKSYPTFLLAPNQFRVLLPTTPLDRAGTQLLQVRDTQSGEEQKVAVELRARSFPIQHINLPPKKAVEATADELKRIAAFKQLKTPKEFWHGPFLRPNQGPITTIYGVRRYYNGEFAKDYYHAGIDYAGAFGSPVVAPAAGRVALVGRESQGFRIHGNCIGIDHGQGVASIFMHLSRIYVKEGDFVQAGQVIGEVGSTGAATGPHLHWGVYVQGEAVDPVPWLSHYLY